MAKKQSQRNSAVLVSGGFGRNRGSNKLDQFRKLYNPPSSTVRLDKKNRLASLLVRVFSGGPKWIVGGTVFEMWLGSL